MSNNDKKNKNLIISTKSQSPEGGQDQNNEILVDPPQKFDDLIKKDIIEENIEDNGNKNIENENMENSQKNENENENYNHEGNIFLIDNKKMMMNLISI